MHFSRWIENMEESGCELYWFDVKSKGEMKISTRVEQLKDWEKRKFPYIKGEYWLSKKLPGFYNSIRPFLEVTENEALERIINTVKPHLIHSFEMQSCSYPILQTMQKFSKIKWLYSCWGSDLYYYKNQPKHLTKIKQVLNRIDYLHTDCKRDFDIAKEIGFNGKHVGVIPGGGGYEIHEFKDYKLPIEQRKIILVKGYQHLFGRGLNSIKALEQLKTELSRYEIVVFGAHTAVQNYSNDNNLGYKVYGRHDLAQEELLELMGKSLIYIGNSTSDGMPNTLLEAIIMGAFPIQSNPGGATAEIISNGKNGCLIDNPENIDQISGLILSVVNHPELLQDAYKINQQIAEERLGYYLNQQKILSLYEQIEKELCE